MSWIGNLVAAAGALQAAKFNKKLYDQQAALNREKAIQRQTIYNRIERPRLIKQQQKQYSELFVGLLSSGVEFREGTTPFFVAQEQLVEQASDLAIADFNLASSMIDSENQSLLLQAKGEQALLQGKVAAVGQLAKAGSSMQSNYQNSGSILG